MTVRHQFSSAFRTFARQRIVNNCSTTIKNTISKFHGKVNLSTQLWGANNNTTAFIYLQKGQRRKKSISLGVQGVNWRAITKESEASTHEEKEEVERQTD